MIKRMAIVISGALLALLACTKSENSTSMGPEQIGTVDPRIYSKFLVKDLKASMDSVKSTRLASAKNQAGPLHRDYKQIVLGQWGIQKSIGRIKFDSLCKVPNSVVTYNLDTTTTPQSPEIVEYTVNRVRFVLNAAKINPVYKNHDTIRYQVRIQSTSDDTLLADTLNSTIIDTINLTSHYTDTAGLPDTGYYSDTTTDLKTTWYEPVHQRDTVSRHDTLALSFKHRQLTILLVPLDKNKILTFEMPQLEINFKNIIASKREHVDTTMLLPLYTDYSILDLPVDNSVNLDTVSISAYPSNRSTVVKIDLEKFWQSMVDSTTGDTFASIQSARLFLPGFTYAGTDTSTSDSFDVSYYLTSTPLLDSTAKQYRGRLSTNPASDTNPLYLNVRDALLTLMINNSPPSPKAYLTLFIIPRPTGRVQEQWGTVNWNIRSNLPPFTISAIFSFPR